MVRTDASTDRTVLEALYNATDGINWTENTHWLSDRPLGEWDGVATDAENRVTELRLTSRGLRGRIPPEIANLTSLQTLNLGYQWGQPSDHNQLSGEIPPEIANLANLEVLNLSGNQLGGEILPGIANLANLRTLNLSGNQLSG